MIGDTWEGWNDKVPPSGIIIEAYAYYDPNGTMIVGTRDEVSPQLHNLGYGGSFMWRLTGIGKHQLENRKVQ